MFRLELVAVQIEEAHRLAQIGRLPHLRMAFLLLDNAAEMMLVRMFERATEHLEMDQMILDGLLREQSVHDSEAMQLRIAELQTKVIPTAKFRKIEQGFSEKANFLVERGKLDLSTAEILKRLHHYRNLMYHQLEMRSTLISTALSVYFDVDCEILAGWTTPRIMSSEHSHSDLRRIGIDPDTMFDDTVCRRTSDILRTLAGIDVDSVRVALVEHLHERINEIDEDIDFIFENSSHLAIETRDDLIRLIQLIGDDGRKLPSLQELRATRVSTDTRKIESWTRRIEALASMSDRLVLYARFAGIELEFEPFEELVQHIAGVIDRKIQFDIDVARGK